MDADPKLIEAFTLMWGRYPAAASLVHRSRTIVAVNEACRRGGREVGMNCAKWPSPTRHEGCLANRALDEQLPMSRQWNTEAGSFRSYWLPVPGYPDFFVHFSTEAAPGQETAACGAS